MAFLSRDLTQTMKRWIALPISGIWAIRLLIPILNRTYRGRERSVARWRATNPTFLLMDIRLSFNTTMSRSELRPALLSPS